MEEITNICTRNKVKLELMDECTIPSPNEETKPISEFKQESKPEVFPFGEDLEDLEPPASTNQINFEDLNVEQSKFEWQNCQSSSKEITQMKPEHNEEVKHEQIEEVKTEEFEELMPSRTSEDPMPEFKDEIKTEDEPIADNADAELVASASQCPKMTYEIETNGCSGRRTECDAKSTCDVILGVGLTSDIASNSVQKSNLCTMCNKTFGTKYYLRKHIMSIHNKSPYCDYACSGKSSLSLHLTSVHEQLGLKPFKCLDCNYACFKKTNLTSHIRTVHEKLKVFKCTLCNHSFNRKEYLTVHINSVHPKLKPFKCIMCRSVFGSRSDYSSHFKSVHEKVKPFKCSECYYESGQKYKVSKHLKIVHLKLKSFKCIMCNFVFGSTSELSTHIKLVHEKLKQFNCSMCDSAFSSKSHLSRHVKLVHD